MNSITRLTFLWISVLYFLYILLKILKYLQLLLCQVFDPLTARSEHTKLGFANCPANTHMLPDQLALGKQQR